MAVAAGTVYVEGLQQLVRAFLRAEGALPHDLEMFLEEAGRAVKAQVITNAQETFRNSSDLVGSVDNLARAPRGYVRVTALRREHKDAPFSYPRMWEYGPPPHGGRPFARKAVAEQADTIEALGEVMLAKLGGEWEA